MRFLLDTHVFLWFITDDVRLTEAMRSLLADPRHELFLSAASAWEIAIKASLGRLQLEDDLERFIPRQLAQNGIAPLPVAVSHALHVHRLPPLHRDPFDRLLVAQSILEKMPLISSDQNLSRYPVEIVWS